MNLRYSISGIAFSCAMFAILGCGEKNKSEVGHFTKVDSVTETYLNLKDAMLETWNRMINDDNHKIKAMYDLLHELKVSDPSHREEYDLFEERLDHLEDMRYTQKSMENGQLVEEYDFASNSLVTELVSTAESQKQFSYNTTMQKLVEVIRTSDQRVENYRLEYDSIAMSFNEFLEANRTWLKEIDQDSFLEKKPLFQMVAEE